MSDRKIQLEKLLIKNKVKHAKIQLIDDLKNYYNIDISDKKFFDFLKTEEVYQKVYELIKTNDIKSFKIPYSEEILYSKIEFIFEYYKSYEQETVLFYPPTAGLYSRNCDQLILNYPLALVLSLLESKNIIMKFLLDMQDDLIIVSENYKFGFVMSVDEYSDITIEYWGK
ncbi:hypothetical protein [Mangrovibacillus cuniculi]|uniref:Uncharacterized protein n=1 Tax=Mangrovibacillus cuniculi TaxID=2593652 RepID=A0A7S8HG52_9BACI|nr:hypothetical protein [Mangrovibacillus cuniculi]QPC47629.1 hypothetical protein G8O30_12030 [Mangrovibacillus cuniculi]